jgi:hypothetical protein
MNIRLHECGRYIRFYSAAVAGLLFWRTRYRTVRTEHAAIAGLRFQQAVATEAFEEILAGISGHDLSVLVTALRTGQYGFETGCAVHDQPWFDACWTV